MTFRAHRHCCTRRQAPGWLSTHHPVALVLHVAEGHVCGDDHRCINAAVLILEVPDHSEEVLVVARDAAVGQRIDGRLLRRHQVADQITTLISKRNEGERAGRAARRREPPAGRTPCAHKHLQMSFWRQLNSAERSSTTGYPNMALSSGPTDHTCTPTTICVCPLPTPHPPRRRRHFDRTCVRIATARAVHLIRPCHEVIPRAEVRVKGVRELRKPVPEERGERQGREQEGAADHRHSVGVGILSV
eukprot:COSAG02_NODE_815_length_16868_cov_8.101258_9_plen_246_part_00